ncbi:MAG: aminotransferase class IV [Acidimicrobiales bacterium]
MSTHVIWVNGELVKSSKPSLSANDHGFLLGDGIFETLKVRHRHAVFIDRHLRRLRTGIDRLLIDNTPTNDQLTDGILLLLDANDLANARVRITVTPGSGLSALERGTQPLTVMTAAPLGAKPSSVSLCTVDWVRNERSPLAGLKSTSWGENASILRFARTNGFDNAILCDSKGRLSECTTSNLFLVIDDQIVTPTLDSGCLPGIIREVLLEEAIAIEGDLFPADLEQATEVFITSSTSGVVPVHAVNELRYADNSQQTTTANDVIEKFSAS